MARIQSDALNASVTQAVGRVLRAEREARGETQTDVAARVPSGCAVPTLSGYETGVTAFTVGRMVELCGALRLHPPDALSDALKLVGWAVAADDPATRARRSIQAAKAALGRVQQELDEVVASLSTERGRARQ